MGGNPLDTKIDRSLLEKIIGQMDLQKMNMKDVVFHVFDAVYLTYYQKYYQELMLRMTVEKRIIKKNVTIDSLNSRVAQLTAMLDGHGIELPKELTPEEIINAERASISKKGEEKAK